MVIFNFYLIIMTSLFHIWALASLDSLLQSLQTLSNARQASKLTINYFFPMLSDLSQSGQNHKELNSLPRGLTGEISHVVRSKRKHLGYQKAYL
jgi:hypothetical protein